MKQRILAYVLVLASALSLVTGCGSNDNKQVAYENEMKNSVLENKKQYEDALISLIQTGESEESSQYIEEYMVFRTDDIVENAEIKQCYHTYNAIYIQINDSYMYRFQLDSDKKVESYIKYELEA